VLRLNGRNRGGLKANRSQSNVDVVDDLAPADGNGVNCPNQRNDLSLCNCSCHSLHALLRTLPGIVECRGCELSTDLLRRAPAASAQQ
jgi:hypothetical protein